MVLYHEQYIKGSLLWVSQNHSKIYQENQDHRFTK